MIDLSILRCDWKVCIEKTKTTCLLSCVGTEHELTTKPFKRNAKKASFRDTFSHLGDQVSV